MEKHLAEIQEAIADALRQKSVRQDWEIVTTSGEIYHLSLKKIGEVKRNA